jgi:hypothetical protein
MSLYLSMLRNQHAKDWKRETPLDGTVLGHNAKLHIHHFFPRALLRKEGWGASDIDTFANYVVLSADTNLNIGTEEPATYLRRERVPPEYLKQQCVPQDEALWRVDRFSDFLEARRRLLSQRSNEFLGL